MSPGKPNRLHRESSPYLRQHAYNPVDWYPWGEEALAAARSADRPILLSIGYSSCHWCHVMERESFENPGIAALMNEHFVNVKVDREERPDLDAIYMNYVQMTTGHGGWPLTVFLTPGLVPFFGGTYFPPESRYGRPGFKTVLTSLAGHFRSRRHEIEEMGTRIRAALARSAFEETPSGGPDEGALSDAFYALLQQSDNQNGGFGGAPKFPAPMAISFLLRWYYRQKVPAGLKAATHSLLRMAQGGIYDQLGGGFHRYSVDAGWLVPHFEKMLYDNALLSRTYLEAYLLTGDRNFRQVVEETLSYLLRDMADLAGGFYSAEDADSEGVEGRFYVWSESEVKAILGSQNGEIFCQYYDVSTAGNWEGVNVLNRPSGVEDFAQRHGLQIGQLCDLIQDARAQLLRERAARTRPARDDKVLASWNGLALTALAESGFSLSHPIFLEAARRNAHFICSEMMRDGRLMRSWKDGEARLNGYLDDYAHVVEGLLALFQVTGERVWLEKALELTQAQISLFLDENQFAFYFTPSDHEPLLIRPKEHFDNATPSGNSTTACNLIILTELTGDSSYRELARRILSGVGGSISRYPAAMANWLKALDYYLGPITEIVIVGEPGPAEALVKPVRETYLPRKVLLMSSSGGAEEIPNLPLLEGRIPATAPATAFLCENSTCLEPITDPDRLKRLLARSTGDF